jgi:penicillin-binding protein-related factor A (putative recombinase)
MGTPTLDYIGCCCGWYFTIETKAKGQKITPRQHKTAASTEEADGMVFFIMEEDDIALLELEYWLLQALIHHNYITE